MKRFDNAGAILDLVFESSAANAGDHSEAIEHFNFLVIPGQHGPRWIVPSSSLHGKSVLARWRPYSIASKIKWNGLRLLYAMEILGKIPGINLVSVESGSNLKIPGLKPSFTPVVYVGTPGSQQKAVVTLVSNHSGEPRAIMKVAMGEGATASLMREALNLEKLAGTNVQGVPTLMAVEDGGKRTWQTVVDGRLTSRKLTRLHIDWLLQLPRPEKSTTLSEQQALLRRVFEKHSLLSGNHGQAISAAIAAIHGGQIPLVLVHGDFAPWNLKRQADGRIAAIDWEEADWAGLPLWDLCHFFLMQAHLFKERNSVRRLCNDLLVQRYLLGMALDQKDLVPLVLIYILLTLSGIRGACSEAYRGFLLLQIPSVIVA